MSENNEIKPVYLDCQHLERMYLEMVKANDRNMKEKFEALAKVKELEDRCEILTDALKSAKGWVYTHAMQTYSKVAQKEAENIDRLLLNENQENSNE